MQLLIDGEIIETLDCANCSRASFCALNLSNVITLLQQCGIDEYKLFIIQCKNFERKKDGDNRA